MKKTLFSLEEIMPSNIYKGTKESTILKNKDKDIKKEKSAARINKNKSAKKKHLLQNNLKFDFSKTPIKIVGKTKINKFINGLNECNKNSNNNAVSSTSNGKQMLLLEYFLQNNNRNVKQNLFLIGSNKEELKNHNKVTKSLLPMKKQLNNPKLQNNRYINKNAKNMKNINRTKEKNNIKKNVGKIVNKKEKLKETLNKKDEDVKNNTIILNKTNTISSNNINNHNSLIFKVKNKEEKEPNLLKTSVNLSNKKKDIINSNNENNRKDLKEVKTPNSIFKNKIISILNNFTNKNDLNELNRSDNLLIFSRVSNKRLTSKNRMKSNSLEKFLNHKFILNNMSTKSLFSLTKLKKRNQSENSFLPNNNLKKSDENSNVKKLKKNIKENKSCDAFFQKKNSACVEKINLRIVKNNKDNIIQKPNNKSNNLNGSTKKNFFNSAKMMKKFKKHKSMDFNSKNSLNGLIISQNEIKDLAEKKDNKTPEKDPQVLNIHIEYINIKNPNPNQNKKFQNYTYHIIPGNNLKLIEKCLLNRKNWIPSSDDKKEFANLIWTPLSSQINFKAHSLVESSQFVNHFEYHNELTNKSKTFINLLRYCEFNDIDLFSFYPLTIIFTINSNIFNSQIENFKKLYNEIPKLIHKDSDEADTDSPKFYSEYFNVNLSKKLGSLQKLHIPKTHYAGKNLWLIKRDNLNRGRKIKVLSNLDDILKEINALNE